MKKDLRVIDNSAQVMLGQGWAMVGRLFLVGQNHDRFWREARLVARRSWLGWHAGRRNRNRFGKWIVGGRCCKTMCPKVTFIQNLQIATKESGHE